MFLFQVLSQGKESPSWSSLKYRLSEPHLGLLEQSLAFVLFCGTGPWHSEHCAPWASPSLNQLHLRPQVLYYNETAGSPFHEVQKAQVAAPGISALVRMGWKGLVVLFETASQTQDNPPFPTF